MSEEHEVIKKKELETGPKASYGYGGKFGTERDRMDKVTIVEGFLGPHWKSFSHKVKGIPISWPDPEGREWRAGMAAQIHTSS